MKIFTVKGIRYKPLNRLGFQIMNGPNKNYTCSFPTFEYEIGMGRALTLKDLCKICKQVIKATKK